ncbi:putative UDP-glucuronate:xylan alpha-glucuronosyltransferase 4 [Trifolium pratense]|uniref:putative UDP-glucuronate:xylan alpha-glucuronosyltransferase 4 n=1 Tax=Trifolium pratense TaxID=57577 RepID=UPI001E69252C|nr:putative UDP-glucuronate:xylan alpha-glucuronosyltransferase 4 [Trifolium pratense]
MSSKFSAYSQSHSISKQRCFLILFLVSIPFLMFVLSMKYQRVDVHLNTKPNSPKKYLNTKPAWFEVIAKGFNGKTKIKIGLVNVNSRSMDKQLHAIRPQVDIVPIHFDRLDENLKWSDFFPEWIDEENKWDEPKCPDMPMPSLENYKDLDVVIAMVPCGEGLGEEKGIRDLFRLQVNLVVANLAVETKWQEKLESRNMYVVFVGSCGPMSEIFRCDDLLMHQGDYWVYKPNLKRLKQKTLMPVGSCQISPGYAESGKETWRMSQISYSNKIVQVPKLAYVTVLHSSEDYVCGAIALAQSILLTRNTIFYPIDLVLLADDSIGPKSIRGLTDAGWKIKRVQRIESPFAKKTAYNRWNYSKLRIWQLTMYDKIIFIDSDFLVLKNIDGFFAYPQLSAAPNENVIFNSGLIVVEPSQCMFGNMMNKTSKVKPYNGGDQGFLNEIFTWWHRLPSKLNHMKSFTQMDDNDKHEVPKDVYALHYLGLKPWTCYRDYDCNWDMQDHHIFASDSANEVWWRVYDTMPKNLQQYCALTKESNERNVKHRKRARNASFPDGHWRIEIKDPRKMKYLD